ncbi:MAG TPA: GAF domain-containing protein [Blastocatellia bacterium]|nr:GAF domain-containing protein [Blastocatellia bacterium]
MEARSGNTIATGEGLMRHLSDFEVGTKSLGESAATTLAMRHDENISAAEGVALPICLVQEGPADPDIERGSDDAKGLSDLARAVISTRSIDELIAAFADTLNSMVPFCTCAITLVDSITGVNTVRHAVGLHADSMIGRKIELGEGVTGWVLENRKPFWNANPRLDLPISLFPDATEFKTLIAFPIISNSVTYGAVTLYSSKLKEYSQSNRRLMKDAVALMSTALAVNARTSARDGRHI